MLCTVGPGAGGGARCVGEVRGQRRRSECDDVIPMQPRQTVLSAAGSIGQASGDLLRHMGEGETDERFQVVHPPTHARMYTRTHIHAYTRARTHSHTPPLLWQPCQTGRDYTWLQAIVFKTHIQLGHCCGTRLYCNAVVMSVNVVCPLYFLSSASVNYYHFLSKIPLPS